MHLLCFYHYEVHRKIKLVTLINMFSIIPLGLFTNLSANWSIDRCQILFIANILFSFCSVFSVLCCAGHCNKYPAKGQECGLKVKILPKCVRTHTVARSTHGRMGMELNLHMGIIHMGMEPIFMLIIHMGMELNLHKTLCHFLVAQLQVELNLDKTLCHFLVAQLQDLEPNVSRKH
jgi:hypothetical protein